MTGSLSHPEPPAEVERYFEALGFELGLKFIETFGGTKVRFNESPRRQSKLVLLVGYPGARALWEVSARLPARVPLVKGWRARVYLSKGLSRAAIARKLGVTDETVRGYLSGVARPGHPDQLSLF